MSTYLLRGFFFEVLDEYPKIVLPAVIFEKKILTPNFTKFLKGYPLIHTHASLARAVFSFKTFFDCV